MFSILYIILVLIALSTVVYAEHHNHNRTNSGKNNVHGSSYLPWKSIKECIPPREVYIPALKINHTQSAARNYPPIPWMQCDIDTLNPWGQNCEDLHVYQRFFQKKEPKSNGFFIEMGGLDGITFSNTQIFELCFGWNGMLIEGNVNNYKEMIVNRPCTQNIWSVACKPHVSHALLNNRAGVSEMVAKSDSNTILAPCRTLRSLFREYDVRHIDFFSLDVEGFEAEVIETIDFRLVTIDVLIAEDNRLSKFEKTSDKSDSKNKRLYDILTTTAGMYKLPSDINDLPECAKKKLTHVKHNNLAGSSVYVSASYRDDIC